MKHSYYTQCKQRGQIGILIIGGILVVLAIAGGAYFLGNSSFLGKSAQTTPVTQPATQTVKPQPTPISQSTTSAEMTNWKTYKNSIYQFSYPKEWYIQETINTEKFYLSQQDVLAGLPNYVFSVNSYEKKLLLNKITFDDPVGTRKETADKVFTTKTRSLTIDNHAAFELQSEVLPGSQTDAKSGIGIYIDMGQKAVYLTIDQKVDPEYSLIHQILSTFKFADQNFKSNGDFVHTCPTTKNLNCQPLIDSSMVPFCKPDYLSWAEQNCPGLSVVR